MLKASVTTKPTHPDDSTVDLRVLRDFIAFLKDKYATAPNYEVAIKNLESLMFIKANLEFVRYAVNNWRSDPSIFRDQRDREHNVLRDHNSMAFHLNGYLDKPNGADQAVADLTKNVLQAEVAVADMKDAPEDIVRIFISKFGASDVGCLAPRIDPPLSFHARWVTNGRKLADINTILEPSIDKLRQRNTLEGFPVIAELLVEGDTYANETVVYNNVDRSFDWGLIKQWLIDTMFFDSKDFEEFHQRFLDGCAYKTVSQKGINFIQLTIKDNTLAQVFYNYVKLMLPEQFKQEFARGRLKPHRDGTQSFMLTPAQFDVVKNHLSVPIVPVAIVPQPTTVSALPATSTPAPATAPVSAAITAPAANAKAPAPAPAVVPPTPGVAKIQALLNRGVRFDTLSAMAQTIAAIISIKTERQPTAGILEGHYVYLYRNAKSSFEPKFIAYLQAELLKQNLPAICIEFAHGNLDPTPRAVRIICPEELGEKFARIIEAYNSKNPNPAPVTAAAAPAAPPAAVNSAARALPSQAVINNIKPITPSLLQSVLSTSMALAPAATVAAAAPAVAPAAAATPPASNNAAAPAALQQVPAGPTAKTVCDLIAKGQLIDTSNDEAAELAQWIGFKTNRPPLGGILADHYVFLYKRQAHFFALDFSAFLKSGLDLKLANFVMVANAVDNIVQIICHKDQFAKLAKLIHAYNANPKPLSSMRSALIDEITQHMEQLAKSQSGVIGANANPQALLQMEQYNALTILKFWLTHEPDTTLREQLEEYKKAYPISSSALANVSAQSPVAKTLEDYLAKEQQLPSAGSNAAASPACVVM